MDSIDILLSVAGIAAIITALLMVVLIIQWMEGSDE